MSERWEYLLLIWVYEVRQRTGTTEDEGKWSHKEDLYIWHPGVVEVDHRPMSDTEDENVSGPSVLEALNELGGDGWELVSEVIRESAVGKSRGWLQAGYPIVRQWTFKRRAEAVGAQDS